MKDFETNPSTKHHCFQGWMPSDLFVKLVGAHSPTLDLNMLCKAISTVQCRANAGIDPTNSQAVPMFQVMWQGKWKESFYFVSLHPSLRNKG